MRLLSIVRKISQLLFHKDPIQRLISEGLTVGSGFAALEDVLIDPSHCWHIRIGNDVTLAPRVIILAHDASTKRHLDHTKIGKVTIGNKVFVGAASVVLPGVTIGSNVIIGAASVITKDIPDNVVVAGNPARILCSVSDFLKSKTAELERGPLFDERFTQNGGITEEMKQEMNQQMANGIGYIK